MADTPILTQLAALRRESELPVTVKNVEAFAISLVNAFPWIEETMRELVASLTWALSQLDDGNDAEEGEVPKHPCGYFSAPDEGYCEFHERYTKARTVLSGVRGKETR